MKYKKNSHTARIRDWLRSGGKAKVQRAKKWLSSNTDSAHTVIHLLHGQSLGKERKKFVAELNIPEKPRH